MTNTSHSNSLPEWAPGAALLAGTAGALVLANSAASGVYESLLSTSFSLKYGDLGLEKPLVLWINDGLMALFFLLIGLELKREVLTGHLREPKAVLLPLLGAVGGMAVPALIYTAVNFGDPQALRGWAIPAATDIAFALAALGILGSRVPSGLKIFLLSLAIFDDIGAIVVIAVFYTDTLSIQMLLSSGGLLIVLFLLNRMGVRGLATYLFVGAILWFVVLKSGVHATLAGVCLALFIPSRTKDGQTPSNDLEHALHGFCMYVVLPTFALANAGLAFEGESLMESLSHTVPLGIALGLIFGNLTGILLMVFLGVNVFRLDLPAGATWLHMAGVAMLCGIGFTMSLFIGSLAFEQGGPAYGFDERLGILLGSAISATAGIITLYIASTRQTGEL